MSRILLSAFACDPYFGSDEEVGWQWALSLSRAGHDVTVLTRQSHQDAIERHIAEHGPLRRVTFEYVDAPRVHGVLKRFNRRNHIYYYLWQYLAFRRAQACHARHPFDSVHHVTWVSFRQPSFMGWLGIPFLFGPVAGGDRIPSGYASLFRWRERLVEYLRSLANQCVRFDPFMRLTFRQAHTVVFTSQQHLALVPKHVGRRSRVALAIGCHPLEDHSPMLQPRPPGKARLVYVGRLIGWKGLDLGLRAFKQVLETCPDARLTIIGDGLNRGRWQRLALDLRIAHAIDWKGWLTKTEVLASYRLYDLLFNPSLRDSGGFNVLESLQHGLPVVCFNLGGPGLIVNEACGRSVEATADINASIRAFSGAVVETLREIESGRDYTEACMQRAAEFDWQTLVARIYGHAEMEAWT